jgi:hypothetical protein
MLGSAMLLHFSTDTKGYQPDGSQRVGWLTRPTEEGKCEYWKLRNGFKLGFWLLLLGFLLQLLDLLIEPSAALRAWRHRTSPYQLLDGILWTCARRKML